MWALALHRLREGVVSVVCSEAQLRATPTSSTLGSSGRVGPEYSWMGKWEGMNEVREFLARLTPMRHSPHPPAGHLPRGRVLLLGWDYLGSPGVVNHIENALSRHLQLPWSLSIVQSD